MYTPSRTTHKREVTPVQKLSRNAACVVVLLSLLVAAHLGIAYSTLRGERPIIWSLHNDTIHRASRADFYAVYHAGVNFRNGLSPYERNPDGVTPYFYPFRYLPIVAVAAQAFTLLRPQVAYFAWVLLLEGLLALLLLVLWRIIPSVPVRLATTAALLINSPYFLEIYMGQFTFASITLCCLALLIPAGSLLFSAAVLLKPMSLVAIPAFATERRYWRLGAWAILCVLLSSVPYFILFPRQWQAFFDINFRVNAEFDAGNFGFVYLLWLLVVDGDMTAILEHWGFLVEVFRVLTLTATALLVFLSKRRAVPVAVSALLLAHFLTYHHVWEHHMSAVCVMGAVLMTVPDRKRGTSVLVLSSVVLLALPTPFALLDVAKDPGVWDPSLQWPRYASYVVVLSKVVPTVILFLTVVVDLCGSGLMSPLEALRSALARRLPPTGPAPKTRRPVTRSRRRATRS